MRNCKQCGRLFKEQGKEKYCSRKCQYASWRHVAPETEIESICTVTEAGLISADARAVRQNYGVYVATTMTEEGEEMNCSECGGASKVYNTAKTKTHVYRERECVKCARRWFTEEYENNSPRVGAIINHIKEQRRAERSGKE